MGRSLITSLGAAAIAAAVVGVLPRDGAASAASQSNRQAPAESPAPFRATGNEPAWRLDIADGTLTLLTDLGQTRTVMSAPRPTVNGGTRTYAAAGQGHAVTVSITDTICVDTMSGMPHPNTVAVTFDGTKMNGCGGEPATLLHGEWIVDSLDGAPVVTDSKLTITFATDGRVYGNASCNRFMGGFTLSGEGLSITQPAASMMACTPDEVMKQEAVFLKLLGSVTKFSTDGKQLTLTASDGRTIRARRA